MGIDQAKDKAVTVAQLASAKHAEAAAGLADAAAEKDRIEAEGMRQAMADQQVMSDAFRHTNGTRKQIDAYIRSNASGAGIQNWMKADAAHQEQLAKTDKAGLEILEKRHKAAGSILATIDGVPPEQLPQAYAQILPHLRQADPTVQWVAPEQFNEATKKTLFGVLQYADDLTKAQREKAGLAETEQKTAIEKQQAAVKERTAFLEAASADPTPEGLARARSQYPNAAKEFPSAVGGWLANAAKGTIAVKDRAKAEQEAKVNTGTSPLGVTEEQRVKLEREKARDEEIATYHRNEVAVQRGRLGLEQKKFQAQMGAFVNEDGTPRVDESGKPVISPTAKAIAEYSIAPPSSRTLGTPGGQVLMNQVMAANPNYKASSFSANNKTAIDYSPGGATGKNLTAADTALAHLDSISKAGEALKSGDFRVINSLANSLGVQVGSDPKTTYDTIVSMVAPEISKAVIGESGGIHEREAMAHNFSASASPQQREQAIAGAARLLGERYNKSAHAYKEQMGVDMPRSLSPASQAVLTKHGGHMEGGKQAQQPSGGKIIVKDPSGRDHPFDTQAQADAFKKLAGIK